MVAHTVGDGVGDGVAVAVTTRLGGFAVSSAVEVGDADVSPSVGGGCNDCSAFARVLSIGVVSTSGVGLAVRESKAVGDGVAVAGWMAGMNSAAVSSLVVANAESVGLAVAIWGGWSDVRTVLAPV